MGYSGMVPREHSTGGPGKARRGGITKTGNAHLRRVLIEAAWAYRRHPNVGIDLTKRQLLVSNEIKDISWKAQQRLFKRFWKLSNGGKPASKAATACARELLGFIWAIGITVERKQRIRREEQNAAA